MNTEFKIFLVIVVIIFSFIGYRLYLENNQETKGRSKQTTNSENITR